MADISELEKMEVWEKVPDDLKEKVKQRVALKEGDTDLNGNVVVRPISQCEWFKTDEDREWWARYSSDIKNAVNVDILHEFFERGATKTQALNSLEELTKLATDK